VGRLAAAAGGLLWVHAAPLRGGRRFRPAAKLLPSLCAVPKPALALPVLGRRVMGLQAPAEGLLDTPRAAVMLANIEARFHRPCDTLFRPLARVLRCFF